MRADARKVLGIVVWGAVILFTPILASAQSPQETLNQYIVDLQKNPSDTALREKIIQLVSTMSSSPEVPSEAKKHISRGVAAIEGAKNPDDFKDACDEFQQVTMLAPWLGNGYRNLAIAQDKAGMYAAALQSLSLYLLTKPSSADVEWAEDLRNKVEYRKEKAAIEKNAEADRKKAESDYLSGHWKFQGGNEFDRASHVEFHLDGEMLVQDIIFDQNCEIGRAGERRESARWRKVSDKVFQRRNEDQGTDITLEFDGDTLIQTLVKWGSKSYYKRE